MNSKLGKSRKSNHKKKAWKHIDLSEINQYLEDKELDERTGFTGQDVFFINKEGDANNFKKNKLNDNLIKNEIEQINNQSSTKVTTKQFKHLGSTSAVPAFKANKRVHQTPLESVRKSERLEKIYQSIEQSKKQERLNREKQNEQKANKATKYDLWKEKEKTPIVNGNYVDYAEDFEKVRLSRIFKCPRKQNLNVLKKPSLLPAVEQPHPGLSYNPNKDEHTDLLISIGEKKKKELKERRKLNKRLKQGFDPNINVHLENAKEMASGLFSESEDNEDKNDMNEDEEKISVDKNTTTTNVIISDLKRRKSNKAKRNEIRERIDKLNAKRRKEKKQLENEFTKLKHYVKEAKIAEKQTNLRIRKREQNKIDRMYRPARLGKRKYEDPEPEFCLEDELNGSLRKINTDGNLLMDRFKSLQRRNLIEHRQVQLKKRSKPARKHVIRSSILNNNNSDLNDEEL